MIGLSSEVTGILILSNELYMYEQGICITKTRYAPKKLTYQGYNVSYKFLGMAWLRITSQYKKKGETKTPTFA